MARPKAKTGRPAIERAQLQATAMQYRLAGLTISTIAPKIGVSKSTAQRLIAEAIHEIKREPTELVIDMELNRLDMMLTGLWKDAVTGDPKAIDRVLSIMGRRAKYLNLDSASAPETTSEAQAALEALMGAIHTNAVTRQRDAENNTTNTANDT